MSPKTIEAAGQENESKYWSGRGTGLLGQMGGGNFLFTIELTSQRKCNNVKTIMINVSLNVLVRVITTIGKPSLEKKPKGCSNT